ncbi:MULTISPECIES: ABC-three component system middle component 2 [Aeromonas]|uniref:Threonine transporter n=1 Tax=Aeromonas media TaxID=651 RepID=A0AAW5RTQ7_AERME|nr:MULTISPECIES: ABC-three component system middle component 2 [Aeromonas]MBQ4681620.1 hypothetical protein [Aeromonas dhakensis]MCV3290822.1 hypothetical protein [Aeromonas media]
MNSFHRLQSNRPFNTPLEYGLRLLFILAATPNRNVDLQRLISYDYLLVHSGDVEGGPISLHPDVPFRGNELLVKRSLAQAGLSQMLSRELINKSFSSHGITYASNELTQAFINLLSSSYALELKKRSLWVTSKFGHMSDEELNSYLNTNVGRWGAEFERFTAVRQLEL